MGGLAVGVKINAPITEIRWRDIRDLAVTADEVGLDSVWSEDHHFGPRNGGDPWDVWSVLAAVAAVTEHVRLGPIVASLNFSSPLLFARRCAAVQEIAGGRLVVGVGSGSLSAEYPKAGLPIDHQVSRFEEAFEIVRRLLAGERFSFHGAYWQVEDTWLSTPPRDVPPFMLGSSGPRMLDIALEHVQGWNVHWSDNEFRNSPEGFGRLNARIDAECEDRGVTPDTVWRSAELYAQFDGAHGLPIDVPDLTAHHGVGAVAEALEAMAEAAADLVQVLVDPQEPRAVQQLAEAVVAAGVRLRRN